MFLNADRSVEPFTSAADCQPSGLQFAVKTSKQAAERAEKMLLLNGSERIKRLGFTPSESLNPAVVLHPLPSEQTSLGSASVDGANDSMTDVEPDSDTHTEITASADSQKKVKGSNRKKAPKQADGSHKKEFAKQSKKAKKESSGGTTKYSDKTGKVCANRTSNSQGSVDKPRMVASSVSSVPTNEAEQSPVGPSLIAEKSSGEAGLAAFSSKTDRSTDKQQATGLPVTVTKAKRRKTAKSVAGKNSVKSGELSTAEKSDDTEILEVQSAAGNINVSPESLAKAETPEIANKQNNVAESETCRANSSIDDKGNKVPHSAAGVKRNRKAASSDEGDADKQTVKQSNQLEFRQEDVNGISPAKAQKMQQLPAVVDETQMNVTSRDSASYVSQQTTGNLKLDGGIGKRGRAAIRRQYANVGNRTLPAAGPQHPVPEGGFSVSRGPGRGRARGSGSVVHRGMGVPTGPYGARGATPARRVQSRGMPVRGRGRMHVVGSRPRCPTDTMLMRNGIPGSGGGPFAGESRHPQMLMTSPDMKNVPVFNSMSNSSSGIRRSTFASANLRECVAVCCNL